jgi:hypothetical protein
MEMRMKGMTVHTKRFVSSVISQVPQIVQGVLQGMGGYFNAAPLQLQAPSSSQPALMLTGRVQTPQGSGTSSRPEPTVGMPGSFGHLKDRPDGSPPHTSTATSTGPRPKPVTVHTIPTDTSAPDVAMGTSKPAEGSLQ